MPTTSIIILAWNSAAHLPRCLASLEAQTYRDFEVIIVDNGSSDEATLEIETKYPHLNLRVERLESNLGFATANNIGAKLAGGMFLALLNADAFPESDWLANLVAAGQRHPNAFFSSCLLQADQPARIDGQGDLYHSSGLAWRRNYDFPSTINPPESEVFSACAAAALYPTEAFLAVGGFDEDYFAYHEDVDLGFRLRLRGLQCFYIPEAVVYHVGSASFGKRGDRAVYLGHRNLVWTFVKNMPGALFWLCLPIHLVYTLIGLVRFSRLGQGNIYWKAKRDAWNQLGKMLEKRKHIQKNRVASIKNILPFIKQNPIAPLLNMRKRGQ
jgi:GT2 family glycosyltransferase